MGPSQNAAAHAKTHINTFSDDGGACPRDSRRTRAIKTRHCDVSSSWTELCDWWWSSWLRWVLSFILHLIDVSRPRHSSRVAARHLPLVRSLDGLHYFRLLPVRTRSSPTLPNNARKVSHAHVRRVEYLAHGLPVVVHHVPASFAIPGSGGWLVGARFRVNARYEIEVGRSDRNLIQTYQVTVADTVAGASIVRRFHETSASQPLLLLLPLEDNRRR